VSEVAAFLVVLQLPPGWDVDRAKEELKTSIGWGQPEIAPMYTLPAASDVEEHRRDPAPPVSDPADGLPGLVRSEGVPITDEQLYMTATVESKVPFYGPGSGLEKPVGDGGQHAVGSPGEADTGTGVGPLNES